MKLFPNFLLKSLRLCEFVGLEMEITISRLEKYVHIKMCIFVRNHVLCFTNTLQ